MRGCNFSQATLFERAPHFYKPIWDPVRCGFEGSVPKLVALCCIFLRWISIFIFNLWFSRSFFLPFARLAPVYILEEALEPAAGWCKHPCCLWGPRESRVAVGANVSSRFLAYGQSWWDCAKG